MAFDFKKEYKEFYMPKNKPEIVTVPKANYIAVRGNAYSSRRNDSYDVYNYDDPDDFADDWAEEFGGGNYDGGYDDAYDYWEENYGN